MGYIFRNSDILNLQALVVNQFNPFANSLPYQTDETIVAESRIISNGNSQVVDGIATNKRIFSNTSHRVGNGQASHTYTEIECTVVNRSH